jgi:cytochrome c nitrite reductase small subunit
VQIWRPHPWLIASAGVLLGICAFTFRYAEGLSYFSTDPRACANCHIMNDQYASWSRGPHHGAARCVDCHLPHEFIGKYVAKAVNGYHHSKGFTLQDFHEPILIKPRNAQILQNNCVRCHGDFVHDVLIDGNGSHPGDARVPGETRCVHCHRDVGHGARG